MMKNSFYLPFIVLFFGILELIGVQQRRLAIIIPSYCNAQWYKKNLDSLLDQDYDNWYAIYIDDNSPDGTADLVRQYIEEHNLQSKIRLIANTERKGALANHYIATHLCDDWDIVVQYDGDDWWPHNHVFSMINDIYNDPDVWLTYGSFEDWPTNVRGYSKPTPEKVVKERLYRESYWTPGQLRTFYAWVFKKIKLEDLLWDHHDESFGKFYPASCDLAFSYPMMEMVGTHFRYIDDVIYIHNVQTPLNDFKVNRIPQIIASNVLLYKKKYDPVVTPPTHNKQPFKGADVMIISHDGLNGCSQTLASCKNCLAGVENIFVLDVTSNTVGVYDGHRVVEKNVAYKTSKQMLVKELHNWWKSTEYVLLLQNGLVVKEPLELATLAKQLESTQAFSFFPSLGIAMYPASPAVHLENELFVWRLCYADTSWMSGSRKLCAFGRKELLRERIAYLAEHLVDDLFLRDLFADGMLMIKDPTITRIGLSYREPKIVEI